MGWKNYSWFIYSKGKQYVALGTNSNMNNLCEVTSVVARTKLWYDFFKICNKGLILFYKFFLALFLVDKKIVGLFESQLLVGHQ